MQMKGKGSVKCCLRWVSWMFTQLRKYMSKDHVVPPVLPCSPWFNIKVDLIGFTWWAGGARDILKYRSQVWYLDSWSAGSWDYTDVQFRFFFSGATFVLQVRQLSNLWWWELLWRHNPSKASIFQAVVLQWTSSPAARDRGQYRSWGSVCLASQRRKQ